MYVLIFFYGLVHSENLLPAVNDFAAEMLTVRLGHYCSIFIDEMIVLCVCMCVVFAYRSRLSSLRTNSSDDLSKGRVTCISRCRKNLARKIWS